MKESKTALQTAIFQALNGVVDVYDVAPTDASYPFVEIGETTDVENTDKTQYGQDVTFTFHIRDRFSGSTGSRSNLYSTSDKLKEALRTRPNNYLQPNGFYITRQFLETEDFTKTADDTYVYFTLHTRITFTINQL